jgi:hypothetical protein
MKIAGSPRSGSASVVSGKALTLAKDGVRVETWSDEMMSAFRRAWNVVVEEEGSRDPFFKDLEKFRAGQPSSEPSSA